MSQALAVVDPQPAVKQECSRCPHINKCWKTSVNNIIINLLVCRIQNKIERQKSTVVLLQMIRPQLQKMARSMKDDYVGSSLQLDELVREMESTVVEHILTHYVIGEIAYFTYYLFGYPNGIMRKWVAWRLAKSKKFFNTHYLTEDPYQDPDTASYDPYAETQDDRIATASAMVDDCTTLRTNEYRIMKFCLMNAHDDRQTRMVDGLHLYMARVMEISRTRVTQHFRNAKQRILNEVDGEREED